MLQNLWWPMYKDFTDFNNLSVQAIDVAEGVVGVRATVAANASAVVSVVVSTPLSLAFEESAEAEGKSLTCPVNIKLLLSTTVRISCKVPSCSSVSWKQTKSYYKNTTNYPIKLTESMVPDYMDALQWNRTCSILQQPFSLQLLSKVSETISTIKKK